MIRRGSSEVNKPAAPPKDETRDTEKTWGGSTAGIVSVSTWKFSLLWPGVRAPTEQETTRTPEATEEAAHLQLAHDTKHTTSDAAS